MNNIYMGYLTESEREELLFEKEMDLINTDIDYLFTTYEAVEDNKKQSIFSKIYEQLKKMIDKFYELILRIKNKKSENRNDVNNISNEKPKNDVKKYYNNELDSDIKSIIDIENDILNDCEWILDRSGMVNYYQSDYKLLYKIYTEISKRSDKIQSDLKQIKETIKIKLLDPQMIDIDIKSKYTPYLDKHHNTIKSLSEKYKKIIDDIDDDIRSISQAYRSKTEEQRRDLINTMTAIKNINLSIYGVYFTNIIDIDTKIFK